MYVNYKKSSYPLKSHVDDEDKEGLVLVAILKNDMRCFVAVFVAIILSEHPVSGSSVVVLVQYLVCFFSATVTVSFTP